VPTQYNNTHKITTHTRQLQQYTRSINNNYTKDKTNNKTHETNYNFTTCTKGKNTQARQYCVQFLVIVFVTIINSLTLPPQSFISHHTLLLQTFSIKARSLPPSLYSTSLHLIPLHFASFTSLHMGPIGSAMSRCKRGVKKVFAEFLLPVMGN